MVMDDCGYSLLIFKCYLRSAVVAFLVECEQLGCVTLHAADSDGFNGAQDLYPAFALHSLHQFHLTVVHGVAFAYSRFGIGIFAVEEEGDFRGATRC